MTSGRHVDDLHVAKTEFFLFASKGSYPLKGGVAFAEIVRPVKPPSPDQNGWLLSEGFGAAI
jgi:hypothetical protein